MYSKSTSSFQADLRSCHSHSHNKKKKLSKLNINNSSQNRQRTEVTRQTTALKFGETDMQIQRSTTCREQKPLSVGTLQTVTDELLEAQCRVVWVLIFPRGPILKGSPHFHVIYLQEPHWVLTVKNHKKIPLCFQNGLKKEVVLL